jgi:hypothetical protein
MEASRQPNDKNYNPNVEMLKSYAQDAEQEGDQEVVSSSTRSSSTTGGRPVGQGDARAPPADLQSELRVVPSGLSPRARGSGLQPRPSYVLPHLPVR